MNEYIHFKFKGNNQVVWFMIGVQESLQDNSIETIKTKKYLINCQKTHCNWRVEKLACKQRKRKKEHSNPHVGRWISKCSDFKGGMCVYMRIHISIHPFSTAYLWGYDSAGTYPSFLRQGIPKMRIQIMAGKTDKKWVTFMFTPRDNLMNSFAKSPNTPPTHTHTFLDGEEVGENHYRQRESTETQEQSRERQR